MDGGRPRVEGYTTQRSYLAGEQITICISSAWRTRSIVTIQRLGAEKETVWTAPVWVEAKGIPADASRASRLATGRRESDVRGAE